MLMGAIIERTYLLVDLNRMEELHAWDWGSPHLSQKVRELLFWPNHLVFNRSGAISSDYRGGHQDLLPHGAHWEISAK